MAPTAGAISTFTFTRLAGANRYATAAAIATNDFPSGVGTVLIATDGLTTSDADALSGNFLAGLRGAPILLTAPNALPSETTAALDTLRPTNIIILGGTAAVSAAVETQLRGRAGTTVTRVAGANRYDTAAQGARTTGATIGSPGTGGRTAFLARSEPQANVALDVSPDALAAGPASYANNIPILLTTQNTTPAETLSAIRDLNIQQVIILGGVNAISAAQETALRTATGVTTSRLAGANRADTSVQIANFSFGTLNFPRSHVNLARGDASADALTGGPHGGRERAPVLVTTAACGVDTELTNFFTANAGTLATGHIFGGTAAICEATATAYQTAARTAPPGNAVVTTRPELVSATVVSTTGTNQATFANPAGTVVRFTFDEAVTGAGATVGAFHLYSFTGARYDGVAGGTGNTTSPLIETPGGTSVLVRFNAAAAGSPAGTADLTTTTAVADLTVATVDVAAVTDNQGQTNPEGDAAIGAGRNITFAAGVTRAPDLVSVTGFRAGASANTTAVDFTFDQSATVVVPAGFRLILTDATELACTGPAAGSTTPGSGGTSPGGGGTTVITVLCPNVTSGTFVGQAPSASNVARGVVLQGTVTAAAAAGANPNPLQVTDTPDAPTTGPDLVSAEFRAGATSTDIDQVLFTFDEPVTLTAGGASGASFFVYTTAGDQVAGTAAARSTVNAAQVLVNFPARTLGGTTVLNVAAGAGVLGNAVTAISAGAANQEDEVGVANARTFAVTPGRTDGPDLTAVALEVVTRDPFTNVPTQYRAVFTFDEAVQTPVAADFRLWRSNGARIDCSAAEVPAGATSTVRCTAFGGATAADVGAAVLGTVDDGAVVARDGGPSNPEGGEPTTGGTGTPVTGA